MAVNNPALRISLWLAVCGLVCFLASLVLPSIQLIVLGSPARFFGVQATAWAIGLSSETIMHALSAHSLEKIEFIVLGAASVLNVTFLITPAVQIWCRPRPSVLWGLSVVSLLGLLLGLIAPTTLEDMHPVALIGYFIWLVGYCFILISLLLALVVIRK